MDLVDKVVRRLKDYQCLVVHEDGTFEPTFLGLQCSFYYIKHETVLHFSKTLKDNLLIEELLKVLSYAKEFEEVPMRHNEDNMNEALSKICPLKADSRKMDSANEKTFLLFQAHLFRLPVPIRDFVTDTKLVIDQSIRMLHAMIDLTAEKKQLNNTLNIILLMQMIIQGVWFTESSFVNSIHFH
jgi:activating signal cointegrator complex subunit 3